jgi:ribA/ribD-fused uncharacterized protein
MAKFVFFWGSDNANGFLSQWTPASFQVDSVAYNCCEQYMMAEKARLFGDEFHLGEILKSKDPKTQKALGRKVSNFDARRWTAPDSNGRPCCWNIVWRGNMARFSQSASLREQLFATGDAMLVEASPYDQIWGIGLAASSPLAQSQESWRGTNWLGQALTSVREALREDCSPYLSKTDPRQARAEC